MIRPLRRAHRWIAASLAIALPLSYAAILLLRPPVMPTPNITDSDLPQVAAAPGVHARLEPRPDGGLVVILAMTEAAPDLLVYWSMEKLASPSSDSVLLGPWPSRSRSYPLPGANVAGYLLIYSVAYHATQAVITVSSLERSR